MSPDDLVEGQMYVIAPDVERGNGEEHPQLDGGEIVKLIVATPDQDGEVYVNGEAVEDDATVGAWVRPEFLWTEEQATEYVREMNEDDDDEPRVLREFSYVPHPDYPNLPTYETLPLGYVMGLTQFVQSGGKPQLTPEQALLQQYLTSRGFPTG